MQPDPFKTYSNESTLVIGLMKSLASLVGNVWTLGAVANAIICRDFMRQMQYLDDLEPITHAA